MKKVCGILLLIFLCCGLDLHAQQLPLFSLYRENAFALNPAIAGSHQSPVVALSVRKQWLEMKESPHTETISLEGPVGETKLGLGGIIINDETGPTAFSGFNLCYAYHLPFSKRGYGMQSKFLQKSKISFGINTSLYYYRLQASELILEEEDDQAIIEKDMGRLMPNAGAGVYFYHENFYAGISLPQVLELETRFKGLTGTSNWKRVNHYYAMAGGRIPLDRQGKIVFEPMAWFRYVMNAPWQVDVNTRFEFNKVFWLGTGYRTRNFMFADLGVVVNEQWAVGYAFDMAVTSINKYLGTSHEIILKYKFETEQRFSGRGRRR